MANDWTYFANIARDEENRRNNELRAREAETERRIAEARGRINTEFDGEFNPDFYAGYGKSLMDYWRPDIDRQYGDAQRTLNFGFAERQPGGGSVPAEAMGRLKEAYDRAILAAGDNATSQANQLRQTNEGQRSALLAQLDAGTDPNTVVHSALEQISNVPRQASYSPIGDLFSNLTGQFATAMNARRAGYQGWGFGAQPGGSAAGGGQSSYVNWT